MLCSLSLPLFSSMGISVSEVAAVLNVVLMFIQYTLPLFIALIAVAIVENTNNAATWYAGLQDKKGYC